MTARRSTLRLSPALPLVLALAALACGRDDRPDAYGTFEAEEVTVSAELPGRLLRFAAREGALLREGERVATVDTADAALQLRELRGRRAAAGARLSRAESEIEVVRAELGTAREELERDRRLLADEAATPREVNLRERDVRVLERRLEAARANRSSAAGDVEALAAQVARAERRLREDAEVENPIRGRVLVTYVDAGEFVGVGQPLYDVASTDTLILHAFLTGAQLSRVALGETVTVRYDVGEDETAARTGRVTRVADEAQFTPTPILTRDERVDFVYEVEVAVPNPDGALKVGMPGELLLPERDGT